MQYQYSESARCQPLVLTKNGTLYVKYKALADEEKRLFSAVDWANISIIIWMLLSQLYWKCVKMFYDSSIMIEKNWGNTVVDCYT